MRSFKTYTLGLTGGIGSGKSSVSDILRELGAVIIDADQIARDIAKPHGRAYGEIVVAFGSTVLKDDGLLDREKLAELVFNDLEAKKRLEAITHPKIGAEILKLLADEATTDHIVVLDIPLLIESGGKKRYPVDKILVITAPVEERVNHLTSSRDLRKEDILARMKNQLSDDERVSQADYVIANDGTLSDLRTKVFNFWEHFSKNASI
ncbi:MAG: dephospho-CoA kinase [Acidimicrobiales bacterium]|nr:dephospho-CoA kinase [Acidimicrobiales bacterium]